jgi:hypothetical protein
MKQTSFSNNPRKCDVGCVWPDQHFIVSLYTRIHCLLRDVAVEQITSVSDQDNVCYNIFF